MTCQCNAQQKPPANESSTNVGLCNACRTRVPAAFIKRDGQVFIRKECPSCGANESLVSSEADIWQGKRDLWQYVPTERLSCSLQCDHFKFEHKPTVVFVDVTNRCNMNCPICIANVRGMGFEYHPPLKYFEKVFAAIGRMNPKPMVELFGGEPTVREDLLEIIKLGRKYGLKPRIVTNGLKLADENYCRELCKAKVRFRLAFDGRNEDIYQRLRGSSAVYAKKMKAFSNLAKYSRRKHAIVACAARNINEQYIGDLIDFCHENMNIISELGIIPLTENWPEGDFEHVERTTLEDVEHMVERSVPGGDVEFVPAGMMHGLRKAREFLKKDSRSEMLMLGGVHPNCESMTLLISDGQRYRSANNVFKMPLKQICAEVLARSRRIDARLSQLDPKKRFDRLRGQALVIRTYAPLILRVVSVKQLLKGHPVLNTLRIFGGLLVGRSLRDLLHQHVNPLRVLRVAGLPFEEYHSIDAARLENCKAVFAYEDVEDGQVKTIPGCTWYLYRNDYLRKISYKWGKAPTTPQKSPEEYGIGEGVRIPVPKMPSSAFISEANTFMQDAQQPERTS